jgi:hypothetical protein
MRVVHIDDMVSTHRHSTVARTAERADALPDLKPWREVGWIFKDGEVVAIERQDDETRVRKVED